MQIFFPMWIKMIFTYLGFETRATEICLYEGSEVQSSQRLQRRLQVESDKFYGQNFSISEDGVYNIAG